MLDYRPAIAFLNGEYWGIHNIREKANENYIASHYNINRDSLELVLYWGLFGGGNESRYLTLRTFIENNNLMRSENYNYVKSRIDVDELLNYLTTEIFIVNIDWPCNNVKLWAPLSNDYKWRWILYDADYAFDLFGKQSYKHFTLDYATGTPDSARCNDPWAISLLVNLLKNNEFRKDFINRFADLTNTHVSAK